MFKNLLLALVIIIGIISCTISQEKLLPGFEEARDLEDIKITIVRDNFFSINNTCTSLMVEQGGPLYYLLWGNFCGCAEIEEDSCHIYLACEFYLEHELKHCQGYAHE